MNFLYLRLKFETMKTKLLLPLFFISFLSFAQNPILNFSGGNETTFDIVSSTNPLDHAATGANQTWNFTNLISIGNSMRNYATPTPSELATYPGTTTVIVNNSTVGSTNTTGYMYTKNTAGTISITGISADDLIVNFVTNNATLGLFPMSFGYSNSDTVAGNYTYTTYSGTFTGTLITTVDAYGTLNLNDTGNLAYSGNVTRLKTVLNLSLNYSIFNNVGTVTQTTYSYYGDNFQGIDPVFRSIKTDAVVSLLSINESNTTLEILTAVLLENNKPKLENISIQNPVTDYITIYSPQNIDNATVQIIDMLGKEIITKTNQTIDENYQIQTNLNKGIYLIRIFDQEKSITKKIIKQ